MGITIYGGVSGGRARALLPGRVRYVALLDVLGMRQWLAKAGPTEIATKVEVAIGSVIQQTPRGIVNGVPVGPLVGAAQFSDSVLLWTLDESWASMGLITGAVLMLVGVAFREGVPIRGAIAVGDATCDARASRYIGRPIAEAYCFDRKSPYRGVGVCFTPSAVDWMRERVKSEPVPTGSHFADPQVLDGSRPSARDLLWHQGLLFVDHWNHGMHGARPIKRDGGAPIFESQDEYVSRCFHLRGLPTSPKVEAMCSQTAAFLIASRSKKPSSWPPSMLQVHPDREALRKAAAQEKESYDNELLRVEQLRCEVERWYQDHVG